MSELSHQRAFKIRKIKIEERKSGSSSPSPSAASCVGPNHICSVHGVTITNHLRNISAPVGKSDLQDILYLIVA